MKTKGFIGGHVQLTCGHMIAVNHTSGDRVVICDRPETKEDGTEGVCGVRSIIWVKPVQTYEFDVQPFNEREYLD